MEASVKTQSRVSATAEDFPVPLAATSLPTLDLRTKRDLHSRRASNRGGRTVLRVGLLLAADLLSAMAAVLVLSGRGAAEGSFLSDLALLGVVGVLGQIAAGTYGEGAGWRRYGRVWSGATLALTAVAVLQLSGSLVSGLSLGGTTVAFFLFATGATVLRIALEQVVRVGFGRGFGVRKTLIIGDAEDEARITEQLILGRARHVAVVGRVSPSGDDRSGALGTVADLHEVIEKHDVANVIVAGTLAAPTFVHAAQECLFHGVAVAVVPGVLGEIPCEMSGSSVGGWPMIELVAPRLHLLQVFLKRSLDVVFSLTALVAMAPLMGLIAAAVRLDSPGPIFFRQRRPGLGGKPFEVLKFRTMRADAEEVLQGDAPLYRQFLENDCKLPEEDDPRITRLGRFLRRWSLDEIPQFINVLRGEMSLVGPRPVVGPELANYGGRKRVLLAVKPGLTGHWQINGRSDTRYPERARLDLQYITEWSLWMDLAILLRTIPVVIRRRGAH